MNEYKQDAVIFNDMWFSHLLLKFFCVSVIGLLLTSYLGSIRKYSMRKSLGKQPKEKSILYIKYQIIYLSQ